MHEAGDGWKIRCAGAGGTFSCGFVVRGRWSRSFNVKWNKEPSPMGRFDVFVSSVQDAVGDVLYSAMNASMRHFMVVMAAGDQDLVLFIFNVVERWWGSVAAILIFISVNFLIVSGSFCHFLSLSLFFITFCVCFCLFLSSAPFSFQTFFNLSISFSTNRPTS